MQIIPDHLVLYLQLKVLGTFISAIAYGIVSVLSGNCIYLLQRKWGTQSYCIRILLLIYVAVMLLFSTLTLFQSICQVIGFMFPPEILLVGLMYLPITHTLTIWGENGFMVRISIPAPGTKAHTQYFRFGVVSSRIRTHLSVPEF